MGEPLADAVRDGSFERVVMENILVDESCELRLSARNVLRFNADARPDRIDFIEGPCGPRLKVSHTQDLPTPLGSPTQVLLSQFRTCKESAAGTRRMAHPRWLRKSITPAL